jgi:transposase-like protein
MTARKKYSKEFKLDAIALVVEQKYSRVEAARNLGLSPQILGRWLKEAEDDGHAFLGNGTLTPEQAEIRSLKGQVKRLEMERGILKKATVFSYRVINEVKYSFITRYKKTWPVRLMCRLLSVKTNNYDSYQNRQTDKPDDLRHQEMLEWGKDIAKFSDNTYGERRIQKVLNTLSFPVSRRKTAQLMKEAGVGGGIKRNIKPPPTVTIRSLFMTMCLSKTL